MHKYITIILLTIIISVLCICTYASTVEELQEQSNQITQNLNEVNNRLQVVQNEKTEYLQKIQDLDSEITQSQEELDKITTEVNGLSEEINKTEDNLNKIQEEYDNLQELIDSRVIEMYKSDNLQFIEVLIASENFTDMLTKYYYLEELNKYDKKLLDQADEQKKKIEEIKQTLSSKREELIVSKQEQQKKSQIVKNAKTRREYYYGLLSEEELQLQAQIDDYNKQIAEVESEIKLLALNSLGADYTGGALTWPIPGHTSLTSLYGMRVHPITGAYNLHTGIDVSAGIGTSFVAAANGVVTKATYNTAYGNMVIIDHGGGVQTLYAHGSEIMVQVGDEVKTGDEVLKVGSTGYSTGPHAHFEIRINGKPVDPLTYLLNPDKIASESKEQETNDVETNTTENQ